MTTQELQNLRKCINSYDDNYTEYYFHMWTTECRIHRHPEDPRGDLLVAETCAVIENCNTGEISIREAGGITFIFK